MEAKEHLALAELRKNSELCEKYMKLLTVKRIMYLLLLLNTWIQNLQVHADEICLDGFIVISF